MTVTVTDDATGVTIRTSPSYIMLGQVNVTIFGPSRESVQACIFDLEREYDHLVFANPVPIGNKTRWGTMGRVWS